MSAPNFGVKSGQEHGYEQVSLNNLVSFKSISSFIAFNWLYNLYFMLFLMIELRSFINITAEKLCNVNTKVTR